MILNIEKSQFKLQVFRRKENWKYCFQTFQNRKLSVEQRDFRQPLICNFIATFDFCRLRYVHVTLNCLSELVIRGQSIILMQSDFKEECKFSVKQLRRIFSYPKLELIVIPSERFEMTETLKNDFWCRFFLH